MTTCTWATAADKNDIIDFIDYVFSKAARPHDFATLLPKLYGEHGDAATHHIIVREDARIAATMVAYPVKMRVAGEDIMTLGIGSVSVHPRSRGKGYMQLMLDAMDRRAAEMDAAFAVLGGQRQRYAYFGYMKAGLDMVGYLNRANVRHAFRHADSSAYSLTPMTEEHVPAAMALHSAQPCYCHRGEAQFLDILRTWTATPYAIMKDGAPAGYCTMCGQDVSELVLADECAAPAVLKLLSERFGDLTLHAACWEKQRAALITEVCESFSLRPENQYKVYQPEKVKALFGKLGSGSDLTWAGFTPPLPLYVPGPDRV